MSKRHPEFEFESESLETILTVVLEVICTNDSDDWKIVSLEDKKAGEQREGVYVKVSNLSDEDIEKLERKAAQVSNETWNEEMVRWVEQELEPKKRSYE